MGVQPPEAAASLESCLELLRGPTDERRVAGLLLVTPYLDPAIAPVNDTIAEAVADALGLKFISRLLLPLRKKELDFREAEQVMKEAGGACLGLQILARLSGLPQVASSNLMARQAPSLCQVVNAGGVHALLDQDIRDEDVESVHDALVCLVAYASCDMQHCKALAVQGGLGIASRKVQDGVERDASYKMLAVRLLGLLLAVHPSDSVLAEDEVQLPGLLSALGLIFGSVQGMQATSSGLGGQSAELQLQAMHTLLLLFSSAPKAMGCKARLSDGCLLDVRQGLAALLQSRTGVRERHGALLLASYMLQHAGDVWLLPHKGAEAAHFFKLLVEVLGVELSLLLHDATSPGALVPSTVTPGAMRQRKPDKAAGGADENAELGQGVEEMMVDKEDGSQAEAAGEKRFSSVTAEDVDAAAQRWQETVGSSKANGAEGMERAGERAARMLPPVFSLLEGCTGVLAADAEQADTPMEEDNDVPAPTRLDEGIATKAASSLFQSMELVLQLLEVSSKGGPPSKDDPLLLAAARVLGRYLKEAPLALSKRVQALLPFLADMEGGQAIQFLLPFLAMACGPEADAAGLDRHAWLMAVATPQVLRGLTQYGVTCVRATAGSQPHTNSEAQDGLRLLSDFLAVVLSTGAAYVSMPALLNLQPLMASLQGWTPRIPPAIASSTIVACALLVALLKEQWLRLAGGLQGPWEEQGVALLACAVERGWIMHYMAAAARQKAAERSRRRPKETYEQEEPMAILANLEEEVVLPPEVDALSDMWLDLLYVMTGLIKHSAALQATMRQLPYLGEMQGAALGSDADDSEALLLFVTEAQRYTSGVGS